MISHKGYKIVHFVTVSNHSENNGIFGVINGFCLECLCRRVNLITGGGIVFELDEHQLTAQRIGWRQLLDGANVGQFIKLIDKLYLAVFLTVKAEGDAGIFSRFGFTCRDRADVELTAAEHTCKAVEYTELISNEHR